MNFIIDEYGCLHFSKNNTYAYLIAFEKHMIIYEAKSSYYVEPGNAYQLLVICSKSHRITIE